ncbi:MAG TPA: ATP-binding protein [Pseudonocardiaceae bacterium]|nr:ATP-binding protein [Pseudonocardiaceae bacterium]
MLRSFRLGNHRSVRDEHELSLLPAYDRDQPALPVIAIFGANASGKSNVLNGLSFMREAVLESFQRWDADDGVPRTQFRLDPGAADRPSTFVVDVLIDHVRHTYGFATSSDSITDEWLYTYPAKRKRVLFERSGDHVTFGSTMSEFNSKLGVLEDLTRPNALFLSVAAQSSIDPLMPIYRWFRSGVRVRRSRVGTREPVIARRVLDIWNDQPEGRDRLFALLAAADVGISKLMLRASEDQDISLVFTHGDPDAEFELQDESDGTRAWLELLVIVLAVVRQGDVLVVDEIDSSLHPLLTTRLVGLFRDPETNSRGAQLIFTTHDASLLGTMLGEEVLARDQVWFVEKDATGASNLYPLTDFKPRVGENTERRYLAGSYGAVPVLDAQEFARAVRDR